MRSPGGACQVSSLIGTPPPRAPRRSARAAPAPRAAAGARGSLARLDPAVRDVHRLRAQLGGAAHALRRLAVGVGVEVAQRDDQRLAERVVAVLVLAVRAPPLDLELGGLDGVDVRVQQAVEARHRAPRAVRVVVGERRPQHVRAQHQPGAVERLRPAHPERRAHERDRRDQERRPLAPVVGLPRAALVAADGAGVEAPHPHAITIVPRAGENVTLRRATFSAVEEAGRSARRRTISSSATRISISANAAPMQRRTPPPNGIHA